MRALVVVQICFTLFRIISCEVDAPEVKIEQGALRGVYRKTWKGRTFRAFTGIPYAKPPVGELRFEVAVPAEPWKGVLDASKPHAICPQVNVFFNNYNPEGDEDCLYLNVYTPLAQDVKNRKLPVMVFIHGGGWTCGDGNAQHYGPDYLLEKDVVLVVMNYRIGAFGFLSTEDDVAPGNYGLKDQVLALKWVQKNIKNFDGDPNKVTIFGQSAGGSSVVYHLLSPLSKGLFHGAIAMSGSALASWSLAKSGAMRKNGQKLAEYLNCPTKSSEKMVQCLKNVDAFDIVRQDPNFYVFSYHPLSPFMPVIEEDREGAFLTRHPMELINEGKITRIPFMSGITSEDGAIMSSALYNDSATIERLDKEFYRLLPAIFAYEDNAFKISKSVRKYYFGNKNISNDTKAELTKLLTDYLFFLPVDTTVRKISDHIKEATYYYLFGYRGSKSLTALFGDADYNYGVSHSDDFYYLLSRDYFSQFEPIDEEKSMRELMVTLWTNFAKFGNPTPKKTQTLPAVWSPSNANQGSYLYIKNYTNISMNTNLFEQQVKFWQNVWHTNNDKTEL